MMMMIWMYLSISLLGPLPVPEKVGPSKQHTPTAIVAIGRSQSNNNIIVAQKGGSNNNNNNNNQLGVGSGSMDLSDPLPGSSSSSNRRKNNSKDDSHGDVEDDKDAVGNSIE